MTMMPTISDLSTIFWESPNRSARELPVSRITVHHTAGRLTAPQILSIFVPESRYASSNYVIGYDGQIGCSVPEEYRAWTSGNWDNDQRAINIEVSNDVNGEPWSISEKSWTSLIFLCADICIRYGFRLEFSDTEPYRTLTAHRFFQATACPGDWLYGRFSKLCKEVNKVIDMIEDLSKRVGYLEGAVKGLDRMLHDLRLSQDVAEDELKAHDLQIGIVANKVEDVPKWARPTIQKMVNNGSLAGSGAGLELNRLIMRVCVILDRLGCVKDCK